MVNICTATESKATGQCSDAWNAVAHLCTFAAYFVMGEKGRLFAFEIKLRVYHSNFDPYHSGKMPSKMLILSHTHQKKKHQFVDVSFLFVINKEMEHMVTKSSGQGWQGRSDHVNRSGSYNDGTGITASRTKHSPQLGPRLHLGKSRQKMQSALLPTQPKLCPGPNKCLGPWNNRPGLEAAGEGWLC